MKWHTHAMVGSRPCIAKEDNLQMHMRISFVRCLSSVSRPRAESWLQKPASSGGIACTDKVSLKVAPKCTCSASWLLGSMAAYQGVPGMSAFAF
jgi:hypothetical protein